MTTYTRELLEQIEKTDTYYLPKEVFDNHHLITVRLELKLAYGALLNVLINNPLYTNEGLAYIKLDNPEVVATLKTLANKAVDSNKIKGYCKELEEIGFIEVDKQDVYVKKVF